jgi:hypothetical protein
MVVMGSARVPKAGYSIRRVTELKSLQSSRVVESQPKTVVYSYRVSWVQGPILPSLTTTAGSPGRPGSPCTDRIEAGTGQKLT